MRLHRVIAAVLAAGCASRPSPVPKAWRSVPRAARIESVRFEDGKFAWSDQPATQPHASPAAIHTARSGGGARLMNGDKPLTPEFRAIDSFDVSTSRGEVVFSAQRKDNFDIGLVSTDGSDVHWIPEEPVDETSVQWAPRGNKVSYLVRTAGGTLVRCVHIPTGIQLGVDFPFASVHSLAWEPQAERYAAAYSTPDSSDRVEITKYDGQDRRLAAAPAERLPVVIEDLQGVLLLHPQTLRYSEKLPLVIWIEPGDRFAWSDARAALLRNARVALAIVGAGGWNGWSKIPWIDATRIYEVAPTRGNQNADGSATLIAADPSIAADSYLRRGRTILVHPAVVESFAAGFIADQLKGQTPPNANR